MMDDDDDEAESSDLTELEDSDDDAGAMGGSGPKPVSDFKAFSAATTTPARIGSGAAATGFSPPSATDRSKSIFNAPRSGGRSGMDSDDDDDDDEGSGGISRGPGVGAMGGASQQIGLEEDPISLEQVRSGFFSEVRQVMLQGALMDHILPRNRRNASHSNRFGGCAHKVPGKGSKDTATSD